MPGLRLGTRAVGEELELELRFDHPMESGLREDRQGVVIPAHHVISVVVTMDEAPLARFDLSPAVSRNPILTLALPPEARGASLKADWHDNRGERGSRVLKIAAASDTPKASGGQ